MSHDLSWYEAVLAFVASAWLFVSVLAWTVVPFWIQGIRDELRHIRKTGLEVSDEPD